MNDVISRQAAIDALKKDMASLDHIIKGMSANDVRLDAYVLQRNQVNYDIYTINNLPTAQPEQLSTNLASLGMDCISRRAAIDAIEHITTSMSICLNSDECHGMKRMQRQAVIELANMPAIQPEIVRCKDCRHYRHGLCMKASMCVNKSENGFCDWGERREVNHESN